MKKLKKTGGKLSERWKEWPAKGRRAKNREAKDPKHIAGSSSGRRGNITAGVENAGTLAVEQPFDATASADRQETVSAVTENPNPEAVLQNEDRKENVPAGHQNLASNDHEIANDVLGQPSAESGVDYWKQAAERLKSTKPEVFDNLEILKKGLEKDGLSVDWFAKEIKTSRDWETQPSRVRENFEKVLRSILKFQGIISVATRFDIHHVAPIVWAGVCVMMQVRMSFLLAYCLRNIPSEGVSALTSKAALDGVKLNEELSVNVANVASLVARYANVEKLYFLQKDASLSEEIRRAKDSLIDLYAKVLEYQVAIATHYKNKSIVRALKAIYNLEDLERLFREINSKDSTCKNYKDIVDGETKFQQQNAELLHWISANSATRMHQLVKARNEVDKAYQGCGDWLIDSQNFKQWSAECGIEQKVKTLWLCGTVGTGKTTLVSRVIEWHLERSFMFRQQRFAFFYFSKSQADSRSASEVDALRSIVRQVARSHTDNSVAMPIKNLYDKLKVDDPKEGNLSSEQCKDVLRKILDSGVKIRLVIDALDECVEPEKFLKTLRDASLGVQGEIECLFAGRPDIKVHEVFPDCQEVKIDRLSTKKDMRYFIENEIKGKEKFERLLKGEHEELENELVRLLNDRAGGMFRWVELQLALFFDRRRRSSHPDSVKAKLTKLRETSIAGIPELNAAYAEVFEMNTSGGEIELRHATKALQFILYALEPLSARRLACAVSVNDADQSLDPNVTPEYVLERCCNFLILTEGRKVEFAHVSAKDYLPAEKPEFSTDSSHAQIGKTCLNYLLNSKTSSDVPDPRMSKLDKTPRLDNFEYAFRHWHTHCIKLSERSRNTLGVSVSLKLFLGYQNIGFQNWHNQQFHHLHSSLYQLDMFFRVGSLNKARQYTSLSPSKHPIFAICSWGFTEVLRWWSETEQDVLLPAMSLENNEGMTPLHAACMYGHIDVVKLLLQFHARTKSVTSESWDIFATIKLSVRITSVLTRHHRDLQELEVMTRTTSLHIAAFCGDVDMVNLLLSYGFNIDGSEECECTPLTIAVTMDHSSVVRVLLEHGASPDSKDKGGKTPLYTAARAGQLPIIDALLEYGAGPNVKRRNGETPLCEAARYCQLAAINTLLEHGASLHVQTESGMTPLHYAAAGMSRSDVLWLLLDKGAKVNALDRTRSTAAHYLFCDLGPSASREPLGQKQRSLQLLISKGASILVLNSEGWTAMRVPLLVIRARLAIQGWAACPEWRVFTQGVCRRFLTALWDTLSVLSDYLVFSNSIKNNALRQGRPTGNQELIDPWVSRDIRETWVTRQQLTRWSLKFLLDGAMLLGDESFVGFSEGSLGGECIRQSSEGSLDGEVQRFVQESLGALLKSKKSFGQNWDLGWDLYIKEYLDVSHEGVESYKD